MAGFLSDRHQSSLHDPSNAIISIDTEVLRGLDENSASIVKRLVASDFYRKAVARGSVVDTQFVETMGDWNATVSHERIPFVTLPYEWSFSMLQDAALLELDIAIEAMGAGFSLKDGTPFNVTFRGASPVFLDIGSFTIQERLTPWLGYRQFVDTFLGPLVLQSTTGIPARSFLRASGNGIDPSKVKRVLRFRQKIRPDMFINFVLHAWLAKRHENDESDISADIARAGLSRSVVESQLRKLRKTVEGLKWKEHRSTWSGYSERTHYGDSDLSQKAEFVAGIVTSRRRNRVIDLGANDGYFSRLAAPKAGAVLAVDSDELVIDRLYRRLRADGLTGISTACVNLSDLPAGSGWMGIQRESVLERWNADLVLALAIIHHVVISDSVPIREFLRLVKALGEEAVVEFPTENDPKVKRLIRNKAGEPSHPYSLKEFEISLQGLFRVERSEELASKTRVLYHLVPV